MNISYLSVFKLQLSKVKQMKRMRLFFAAVSAMIASGAVAQTNVFDDVIAASPNHNYLEAAIIEAGLESALQDPGATLTVFAPDDQAFEALAGSLGTDVPGLLALPNLADILLYHVLGVQVPSSAVTNGAIVQPLSNSNTLKLTVTYLGAVFVNQAEVTGVDITVDNGVVHVLNGVLLPVQTVVDIALNNGFTYLATAVVTAELLPALTNPFATYTVFAPTNEAFDALASDLGTDIAGLLALPILSEVLTYHVLSTEVPSSAVTNGAIVQPLSAMNTLKLTVTGAGLVYVNQAQVTAVDITADNGVVHVINSVVLPFETVVDVALDNNFTTLATALVQEELLPTLTNPFATFTVFAPTNEAFENLATTLGTDINGILALPNLTEVLTYHVLGTEVLSTELVAGPVNTLNGAPVTVSLTNGVMINTANVTIADITSDNGVVHVIDAVLLPIETSVAQLNNIKSLVYPNPTEGIINIESSATSFRLLDQSGRIVAAQNILGSKSIDLSQLNAGVYMLELISSEGTTHQRIVKK
jgi:uncharacterized surface protein with fasciclin (FAS1) repeats